MSTPALDHVRTPRITVSGDPVEALHEVSTHAIDADDRIALWEDYNARVMFDLGVRSLDNEPLEATQRSLQLPRLTFARVATNTHILERTQSHLAKNQTEGVMLFFMVAGESFFHHRQGTQIQRPGTVLICDMTQPFIRGFSTDLREFVLTVPREIYEQATEGEPLKAPILQSFANLPGNSVHAAELARLMGQSLNDTSSLDLAETEERAIELLRAVLSPASSSQTARHREALAWIRKNLRDPSLSVTSVAEAIGVSERTLTRAFGETGRGVARTILQMRLERAHGMLSHSPVQVQEVAASCGFVSAAHFSRVFRTRYGVAPAELQRELQVPGTAD